LIQIAKFGDIFFLTEPRIFNLTFGRRSRKSWLHHRHKVLVCCQAYFCPVLDINPSSGFRNDICCHLNKYPQAHPITCKLHGDNINKPVTQANDGVNIKTLAKNCGQN